MIIREILLRACRSAIPSASSPLARLAAKIAALERTLVFTEDIEEDFQAANEAKTDWN